MKNITKKLGLPIFLLAMLINLSLDSQGNLTFMKEVKSAPETTVTGPKYAIIRSDCVDGEGDIYDWQELCVSGMSGACNPTKTCGPAPTISEEPK